MIEGDRIDGGNLGGTPVRGMIGVIERPGTPIRLVPIPMREGMIDLG